MARRRRSTLKQPSSSIFQDSDALFTDSIELRGIDYSTRPRSRWRRARYSPFNWLVLSLVLLSCISTVLALDTQALMDERLKKLARRGEILIDRSPPPILQERQLFGSSSSAASSTSASSPSSTSDSASTAAVTTTTAGAAPTTITAPSSTVSSSGSSTAIDIAPSSTGANGPLPSPFDTSLGTNFTSTSCPTFFDNFLNNDTFKSCSPISLLFQNSQSFFHASRSPVLLSQTLDQSCGANFQTCSALMSYFANAITQDSNCGQDYRDQNPLVMQAHAGFVAYEPEYRATCLKNTDSGNYCLVDAFTNSSNPSDSYPYYLPLGLNLPGSSRLTCDKCLQNTMSIFAGDAGNKSQPLSSTYLPAAQQIDVTCGPTFVNSSVSVTATTTSGAAMRGRPSSGALWVGLMLAGLVSLL